MKREQLRFIDLALKEKPISRDFQRESNPILFKSLDDVVRISSRAHVPSLSKNKSKTPFPADQSKMKIGSKSKTIQNENPFSSPYMSSSGDIPLLKPIAEMAELVPGINNLPPEERRLFFLETLALLKKQRESGGNLDRSTIIKKLNAHVAATFAHSSIKSVSSKNEPRDYFNDLKYKKQKDFLSELGISSWKPTETSKDLSSQFLAPVQQGDSFACVPIAVTNDMEAVMKQKIGKTMNLSEWFAYNVIRGKEELGNDCVLPQNLSEATLGTPLDRGVQDVYKALTYLQESGAVCPLIDYNESGWLENLNEVKNRKYSIKAFSSLESPYWSEKLDVDYDFFRIFFNFF